MKVMEKLKLGLVGLLIASQSWGSATRIIDAQQINNAGSLVTVPAATDTLVGRATTDTMTNKTMSGASNTFSAIPTSAIAGSALSGTNTGDVTLGTASGLSLVGQALSLGVASAGVTGALSGTDWSTFNSKLTNPMTTLGDVIYGGASGTATRLVGNTTTGKMFLSQTGDGTDSAAPAWSLLSASDIPNLAASKITTGQLAVARGGTGQDFSASSGAVIFASGTASAVAAGSSGNVLTSNGTTWVSSAPSSAAPSISGSTGTPTAITAVGGISFSGVNYNNIAFIEGDSAPITVTANPQIAAGTSVGQNIVLVGQDATNTVTLADGTGLSLNGSIVIGLQSVIGLMWDGTVWVEQFRR